MAFPKVVSRLLDKKKPTPREPTPATQQRVLEAFKRIPVATLLTPDPNIKHVYLGSATHCPEGKCLMSANAANRVKDAVERVVTSLDKAADGTAERLNRLTEEAMDKFHRVERSVSDPLEQALKGLDELLGSNNGPPLE